MAIILSKTAVSRDNIIDFQNIIFVKQHEQANNSSVCVIPDRNVLNNG